MMEDPTEDNEDRVEAKPRPWTPRRLTAASRLSMRRSLQMIDDVQEKHHPGGHVDDNLDTEYDE